MNRRGSSRIKGRTFRNLFERGYAASQRREAKRATARPDLFFKERPCGWFQRTILLPDRKLDADAMDVKLDKGVLKVTIPKKNSSEVVSQFAFVVGYEPFLAE